MTFAKFARAVAHAGIAPGCGQCGRHWFPPLSWSGGGETWERAGAGDPGALPPLGSCGRPGRWMVGSPSCLQHFSSWRPCLPAGRPAHLPVERTTRRSLPGCRQLACPGLCAATNLACCSAQVVGKLLPTSMGCTPACQHRMPYPAGMHKHTPIWPVAHSALPAMHARPAATRHEGEGSAAACTGHAATATAGSHWGQQ